MIATPQGVLLRVGDVAEVMMGQELRTGAVTMDGREVVFGTVSMLLARTVALARRR